MMFHPETEMSTVTIRSVPKEVREATEKPKLMPLYNKDALLKFLGNR
jgi:hypothetical protein